jgi:hypothetical protein
VPFLKDLVHEDFEKWHLVMRQRWTRMSEGRSKARGEERQGQCTRNEDMWTKEAERRIGIQGTIVEHRWRCNLTTLGIERRRQDKIIRRCMTASIEGMQRVLSAAETGGEG